MFNLQYKIQVTSPVYKMQMSRFIPENSLAFLFKKISFPEIKHSNYSKNPGDRIYSISDASLLQYLTNPWC